MVTKAFEKWANGYSGCDGGNPRGTWVCGIEYGGGETEEMVRRMLLQDVSNPPPLRPSYEEFLQYRYNQSILKILSALSGKDVGYHDFADSRTANYFKLNLYPLGFKDVSDSQWLGWYRDVTGFVDKQTYREWCQKERFLQMRSWATCYTPKLIICTGKTYADDFFKALCDRSFVRLPEVADSSGKPIQCAATNNGRTLVAVTYFPGGRYGLNSNEKLARTGRCLAALLRDHGLD